MLDINYKPIHELYDSYPYDFSIRYASYDYHLLHELFDEKYNIADFNFSFDLCCSALIEALFKEYVKKRTIVIASRRDHPSVHKCLEGFEYRELIYLDDGEYLKEGTGADARVNRNSKNFSFSKLSQRLSIKNYDSILVLSYGSNVCDGEVRDNEFFSKIFKICELNCDNTIKVLDDCQGSLWIDRDYSIYDYVLWTAHATLWSFDVGILLSKPNMPALGVHNVGEEFLYDNYKRLLMNKPFVSAFNKSLTLATGIHLSEAPHLFCLPLTKDYPEEYFYDLQRNNPSVSNTVNIKIDSNRFIRLRVENFLRRNGKFNLLRALRYIYAEREFIAV